jgi:Mce-associated membrane protein
VNASWYDLLDVDRDASDEEVRVAWKAAIADLDPTDRTFRVYNQAAEVLLDPGRRAAYDAELAEAEEPAVVAAALPAAPAPDATPGAARTGASPASVPAGDRGPAARSWVPAWLLAGLAVATAAVVGLASWLYLAQPSDASVEDSTKAAQAAAERAIGPILSYDARHLDRDKAAAESYLTSDYQGQYDKLFALIKQNAPQTGTVVTAQVVASGIVRSGEDRVQVLLFVNRPTTNKLRKQPVVYKDQVTVTMERVGGDWLVDDLVTSPVGG